MTAYYNEHDPKAAAWLRELIKAGLIAPGDVDERSIEDVVPNELAGYTQCHFFAGIGGWSYALRCAEWPDDRPVWTGSCPCQPFSSAGKRGGTSDERHLWPAFHHLISQCQPDVVFGEQVASDGGLDWLDLVHADLEAAGYAVGALDLCAAGLGAPHIRQRLYFVAQSQCERWRRGSVRRGANGCRENAGETKAARSSATGLVADASGAASERNPGKILGAQAGVGCENEAQHGDRVVGSGDGCITGLVADASNERYERGRRTRDRRRGSANDGHASIVGNAASERRGEARTGGGRSEERAGDAGEHGDVGVAHVAGQQGWQLPGVPRIRSGGGERAAGAAGATNGYWRDADWIYCRDGKYRAVEPGSFPLAYGVPARVGRLRGYGNAIVAPVAEAFVKAYLETL